MRTIVVTLLVVGAGLLAILLLNRQLAININSSQSTNHLALMNLPASYCPSQIELAALGQKAITSQTPISAILSVNHCADIDLGSVLTKPGSYQLIIKAPWSLAVSYSISVPTKGSLPVTLRLGDANNDNVIDEQDQKIISDHLFVQAPADKADVDGDGLVSVMDLSLAKLNQGVGVKRPDGQNWQEIK
jgi:hypothetical protein